MWQYIFQTHSLWNNMPQIIINEKLTLNQVMACCQITWGSVDPIDEIYVAIWGHWATMS